MKIMILTSSMESGGAQTHIFELAKGLMERGHSVVIVSGGGCTARSLARLGARCYCVQTDTKEPISALGGGIALYALIKKEKPDLIHAHSRLFGVLCRGLKKISRDFPVYVSTVHAHFSTDSVTRRIPWYSSRSIAVSEDLKQYIIDESRGRIMPENIEVIPNGIDTERFSPTENSKDGERFKLCFMSRLDTDCSETAYLLCRAAKTLEDSIGGVEIYIIGGGSELEKIREIADGVNKGIGSRVLRVLGKIDAPELILSRCDGFVGVSRAALEAMSCGLPVILSGNEGFGGLVLDDGALSLAKSSNFCCRGQDKPSESLLLQSVEELYKLGNNGRERLGKSMREFVLKNNSSESMVEATELFYKRALESKKYMRRGVLLCGYYGFGNMGDDALLLKSYERACGSQSTKGVSALTASPRRNTEKFGIRCVGRGNPFAVAKEIRECSKFVLGGGSLLQSATSFRSLCWYSALIAYADKCGKRVELWANGLGSFKGSASRKVAARALGRASRIGVRDAGSETLAQSLLNGDSSKIFFEKDLAFSTAAASEERISYLLTSKGIARDDKIAVVALKGTSVVNLLNPTSRKKLKEEYARAHDELKNLKNQGIKLIFVPMFPKNDMEISVAFCKKYNGILIKNIGAPDLLGIISRAQKVITMRYHALVFAAKSNKKYVAIGSDPKLKPTFFGKESRQRNLLSLEKKVSKETYFLSKRK